MAETYAVSLAATLAEPRPGRPCFGKGSRRVRRRPGWSTTQRTAGDLDSTDLARALMLAVDWIALNAERSLGLRPATAAEQALSTRLLGQAFGR